MVAINNHSYFIEQKKYDAVLNKAKSYLKQKTKDENCLSDYSELLALRDQAFPLLLTNGQEITLDKSPTHLYQLPLFKEFGTNKRWFLVQYPAIRDDPPSIEILCWELSVEKQATITIKGKKENIKLGSDCVGELSQRAQSINWHIEGEDLNLTLQFKGGQLKINLHPDEGIAVAYWRENKKSNTLKRLERSSADSVDPILWVYENHGKTTWYRDSIGLVNNNVETRIELPDYISKITAVNSTGVDNKPIYLGDSRAFVHSLQIIKTLESTKAEIVSSSCCLGGKIYDLLIIPHPDKRNESAILVSTDKGYVYCLEDLGDSLKVIYYQQVGEHLVQLITCGNNHFLALDHYNRLIPLKISHPNSFLTTRDELTNQLYENKKIASLSIETLLHHLNKNIDNAFQLVRLATEHFILHCAEPDYSPASLTSICKWLNCVESRPMIDNWQWLKLQLDQISRFKHWMTESCFANAIEHTKRNKKLLPKTADGLEPLWLMFTPTTNLSDIPDEIWIIIFRAYDSIYHFLEIHNLLTRPDYKERWQSINAQVSEVRKKLLPQMYQRRPITIRSANRTSQHVVEVKFLEEREKHHVFVLLNSSGKLIISGAPKDCSNSEWKEFCQLEISEENWLGQPISLLAGAELEHIFGESFKQLILLATDRGELVLIHWKNNKLTTIWKGYQLMYVRYMVHVPIPNHTKNAILLAGRNNENKGIILRLIFSKKKGDISGTLKNLWSDPVQSEIKKLVIHDNHCWFINQRRRRSALLAVPIVYPLEAVEFKNNTPCDDNILLLTDHPLYCLKVMVDKNQILCGGRGGLIYALDTKKKELLWLVNSGKSIRRLNYLKTRESFLMLLGGDHPHLIMVENAGQYRGVFEDIGPITAMCQFSTQKILIGNLHGRLLILDAEEPQSMDAFLPKAIKSEDKNKDFLLTAFYPLRKPIENNRIKDVYKALLNNKPEQHEYMLTHAWLNEAIGCINKDPSWLDNDRLFLDFLIKQKAHRVALFLADLSDSNLNNKYWFLLLDKIWGAVITSNDVLLPQLVNNILRILENKCFTGDENKELNKLFQKINNYIWFDIDQQNNLDNKQKNSDGPALRSLHFRSLRLGQVLRIWSKQANDELSFHNRLNLWCGGLLNIWMPLELPQFNDRIHWVLKKNTLPLTSGGNQVWQSWLRDITAKEKVMKEVETLDVFIPLVQNIFSPWSSDNKENLLKLWPDNPLWNNWVNLVYKALEDLAEQRKYNQRILWEEINSINKIRGYFRDLGREWFTTRNQSFLLALWWTKLAEYWEILGKQQMNKLLDQVANDPAQYIDLSVASVYWKDDKHTIVSLELGNRHPSFLQLEKVEWNDQLLTKRLNIHFEPQTQKKSFELELLSDTKDRLDGNLNIYLRSPNNTEAFFFSYKINEERSIEKFNQHPGFKQTWQYLQDLLVSQKVDQNKSFVWLNGNYLSKPERERLNQQIKDKFAIDIEQQTFSIESYFIEDQNDKLVFCPDVPRGTLENSGLLLEQVQGILHPNNNRKFSPLALAVWLNYRQDTPETIVTALSTMTSQYSQSKGLLNSILGETNHDLFEQNINHLPLRSLGAWCCNLPLYLANKTEVRDIPENELYSAPASLFNLKLWQALLHANIPPEHLASWLDLDQESAKNLLDITGLLTTLIKNQQPVTEDIKVFSYALFNALGSDVQIDQKNPPFYTKFKNDNKISVLHETLYENCYFLWPGGTRERRILPVGLWLCFKDVPLGLLGTTIRLNEQQILSILFSGDDQAARDRLNQIAAEQNKINPSVVFSGAGGQNTEQSERHFGGRSKEIKTLEDQLILLDNGETAANLIIGNREIGKTSLWTHFKILEQKRNPERKIIHLDLHDYKPSSNWSAEHIERYFLTLLYYEMGWLVKDEYQDWPKQQQDSSDACQLAQTRLINRLKNLNLKPVIILDETLEFSRIDSLYDDRVSKLLRTLVNKNHCMLVATSYPFHPSQKHGLNLAQYRLQSSQANFYKEVIELRGWPKSTAWDYLREKLAGFGRILPYHYRTQMWRLTRGIPSIVHQLGLELCQNMTNNNRRVILSEEWERAYWKTFATQRAKIDRTIGAIEESENRKQFFQKPENRLDKKLFKQAFNTMVKNQIGVNYFYLDDEQSQDISFTLEEMLEEMPKVNIVSLQNALNELTSTPILAAEQGTNKIENTYWFANNLYPAYLSISNKQNEQSSLKNE